jgi:alpha/beta hydrolase family protein
MHSGSVSRPRRRHVTALIGIALLAVALSVGAASAAGVSVTPPPTTGGSAILPPNLNGFDLAQVGYQQSEYFLGGDAKSYHDAGTHHPASTITSVAATSNVVTITTSAAHGIAVGDVVTINVLTNTVLKGNFTVTAVPSTTTFVYSLPATTQPPVTIPPVGDSGTVTPNLEVNQRGAWNVAADAITAPFTTRVVVYRPIDPTKFNGTVIVEWLNVSGGLDANPDWTQTHNELIREGFAWVGVSAQLQGVNQLKCATNAPPSAACPAPGDPGRYGGLMHPGDSYSYDIFSQAGQAIRDHSAQILGGLTPQKLIAAGESQSAGRMVTYIDAVQPITHVYDGFLVHSRGAAGAALSQSPQTPMNTPSPTFIRTDLGVPVFTFQTESDVAGGFTARQDNTSTFRQWEAAGTSHFDTYGLLIGPSDTGDGQGAVANLAAMQNPTNVPGPGGLCTKPINTGGAHWLLDSVMYWLNQWVTNGTAPPIGQPLQIATTSPFAYVTDVNGNAVGGVRTPQVDAPIATLAGIGNTAANGAAISQFCRLFGSTVPFTAQTLAMLYKNHGAFVSAWSNDIQKLVNGGFLLPADGVELQNAAGESTIGK